MQKQCVCLLSKRKVVPVDELFKSHKVMKFPDMIRLELYKFGAKLANKMMPEPLRLLMEAKGAKGGKKTHKHNTRKRNVPNIQKHVSVQYNSSFLCRSLVEFSKLP